MELRLSCSVSRIFIITAIRRWPWNFWKPVSVKGVKTYDITIGPSGGLFTGSSHRGSAFLYHPVRLVGALISFLEKVIRKIFPKTEKGELAGGTLMAVLVMAVTTAVPALLLYFAGLWCVC